MTVSARHSGIRQKAVWGPRRTAGALIFLLALTAGAPDLLAAPGHRTPGKKITPAAAATHAKAYRLDAELTKRAARGNAAAKTRVIVTLVPGAKLPPQFRRYATGRGLDIINGQVLDLPNGVLKQLAAHPDVFRIHYDRPAVMHNYRTSLTIGTRYARQMLGYTGAGIGVAVIDSGIAYHPDLMTGASTTTQYPYGNQRVAAFVDFVNGRTAPYDDNGHGTHVAGTILGNGRSSNGNKAGMAPGASLISLKVLDANGNGTISNIIAALDWVVANKALYNIRVVNMSIGAGIHESYLTDPLTLAAKRAVDAGIVVVAAAGNIGKNKNGQAQYGGITAPGNAPWVLTVGASSTNGTPNRRDDTMAGFSSRGPTFIDYGAKPDIVAPGMGTSSLAAPGSLFYTEKAQFLQDNGKYLVLSGTSMAAPVVSGTVALMLQANPKLTPNAVKAILEFTAQVYPGYRPLEQGAGFLNGLGAIRLARFYAHGHGRMPSDPMWSKRIIWGNHWVGGGYIKPSGSAWRLTTTWGASKTDDNDNIVWGSACDAACDNIVWGSAEDDNIVWGSDDSDNIVWGSSDGDNIVWGSIDDADNIVWGSNDSDNIVWGSVVDGDNIVWGSTDDDNIVWGSDCGGADCDNIVWGSTDADNIVWGSAEPGDNIVWGSSEDADNIVWGSSDDSDNIVWGSSDDDNIVWGSADSDNIVWGSSDDADNIVWGSSDGDNIVWGSSAADPVVWENSATGFYWSGFGSWLFNAMSDEQVFGFTSFAPAPPPPPPPPAVDPPATGTTTDPTLPTSDGTPASIS